jgi:hypothetical protein
MVVSRRNGKSRKKMFRMLILILPPLCFFCFFSLSLFFRVALRGGRPGDFFESE